jgi:hypothetical protein
MGSGLEVARLAVTPTSPTNIQSISKKTKPWHRFMIFLLDWVVFQI